MTTTTKHRPPDDHEPLWRVECLTWTERDGWRWNPSRPYIRYSAALDWAARSCEHPAVHAVRIMEAAWSGTWTEAARI